MAVYLITYVKFIGWRLCCIMLCKPLCYRSLLCKAYEWFFFRSDGAGNLIAAYVYKAGGWVPRVNNSGAFFGCLHVVLSRCQQAPCHHCWCCQPCRSPSSSGVQFVQVLTMKLLLRVVVATPKGLQTCLLSYAASPQRIIYILKSI